MRHATKKDLRDSVTVFVSTVGYPTFSACLEHLLEQDCDFRLAVIDHVAPMSAAFQQMMDTCTTPYYVQVDEDMLLYPHAVRMLYERISAMDGSAAQYVAVLYDVHLEGPIHGLKIFRHEIVRRYPFRNVTGCEWDQIHRLRADGYRDTRAPLEGATRHSENTLGLHGTYWTPRMVYLRFATLERKRRLVNGNHEWVKGAAVTFLERVLETRSELDFYALMGVLSASLSEGNALGQEKDCRTYDRMPGFDSLRSFVEEVRHAWSRDPGELRGGAVPRQPTGRRVAAGTRVVQ